MSVPYDIREVEHLGAYRLRVVFADGVVSEVDLADRLAGDVGPMFEPLKDPAFFARVAVDGDLHTVVRPNGADLAPDALYDAAASASRAS